MKVRFLPKQMEMKFHMNRYQCFFKKELSRMICNYSNIYPPQQESLEVSRKIGKTIAPGQTLVLSTSFSLPPKSAKIRYSNRGTNPFTVSLTNTPISHTTHPGELRIEMPFIYELTPHTHLRLFCPSQNCMGGASIEF